MGGPKSFFPNQKLMFRTSHEGIYSVRMMCQPFLDVRAEFLGGKWRVHMRSLFLLRRKMPDGVHTTGAA